MGKKPERAEDREIVGYIRVSSKEQAETKLSLIHQEEKIRAQAVAHDLSLGRIFNDAAESAKDLNREAVQELIVEIEKGNVGHVVIYKLDRLIRNVENLGYLLRLFEKHGVTLSSVSESLNTSNASGRMVVNLLGMIAEWERDTIAERTAEALSVKRARGEKLGGFAPFGFRVIQGDVKKLAPHPKHYPVWQAILKAKEGGKGYQEIAEELNAKATKPIRGRRWYASTIRAICLRAAKSSPAVGPKAGSRPPNTRLSNGVSE